MSLRRLLVLALLTAASPALLAQDSKPTTPPPPKEEALSALDIMKLRASRSQPEDERAEIEMRVEEEGRFDKVRKLLRSVLRRDSRERTLIRFQHPATIRNLASLTLEQPDGDDEQWVYNPATRKTKRVPRDEVTESFAGTGFALEDFRAEDLKAHVYKKLDKAIVDARSCQIIEATPKDDASRAMKGYAKRLLYIDTERYVFMRIDFFNRAGELLKVQENTRWAVVGGVYRPYRVLMRELKRDRKTYIVFRSWAVNEGLSADLFTTRELEKAN